MTESTPQARIHYVGIFRNVVPRQQREWGYFQYNPIDNGLLRKAINFGVQHAFQAFSKDSMNIIIEKSWWWSNTRGYVIRFDTSCIAIVLSGPRDDAAEEARVLSVLSGILEKHDALVETGGIVDSELEHSLLHHWHQDTIFKVSRELQIATHSRESIQEFVINIECMSERDDFLKQEVKKYEESLKRIMDEIIGSVRVSYETKAKVEVRLSGAVKSKICLEIQEQLQGIDQRLRRFPTELYSAQGHSILSKLGQAQRYLDDLRLQDLNMSGLKQLDADWQTLDWVQSTILDAIHLIKNMHLFQRDTNETQEALSRLLTLAQNQDTQIDEIKQALEESKVALLKTIKGALFERVEKLDDLVSKSGGLSKRSKEFYKNAKKPNSCCSVM